MSLGLQPANVQGTPFLPNYLLGFTQEMGYIASLVAPVMPVIAESSSFWVVPFDYGRRLVDDTAEGNSPAKKITPPLRTGSFTTLPHRLGSFLLDRTQQNAMKSPTGFKKIVDLYLNAPTLAEALIWETQLVTLMTTAATYFASSHHLDYASSTDLQFDTPATSDPQASVVGLADVIQGHSGKKPEQLTCTMGRKVWKSIFLHAVAKEAVKYTERAFPSAFNRTAIADFLGVKQVLVGDAIRVTSNIGASSETSSYVWGRNLFLHYVDEAPSQQVPTDGSFVTPAMNQSGADAEIAPGGAPWQSRSYPTQDPLGTTYLVEGVWGVAAGKPSDSPTEGVRTAGWIENAVSASA